MESQMQHSTKAGFQVQTADTCIGIPAPAEGGEGEEEVGEDAKKSGHTPMNRLHAPGTMRK